MNAVILINTTKFPTTNFLTTKFLDLLIRRNFLRRNFWRRNFRLPFLTLVSLCKFKNLDFVNIERMPNSTVSGLLLPCSKAPCLSQHVIYVRCNKLLFLSPVVPVSSTVVYQRILASDCVECIAAGRLCTTTTASVGAITKAQK